MLVEGLGENALFGILEPPGFQNIALLKHFVFVF